MRERLRNSFLKAPRPECCFSRGKARLLKPIIIYYCIIILFNLQLPETQCFRGFVQFCSVSKRPVNASVSIRLVTNFYLLIQ
nr:MAG TPA: hypothetical protein [Caudoviricetes sp.]